MDAIVLVGVGAVLGLLGLGVVTARLVQRKKRRKRPPASDLVALVQGAVQAGIKAAPVVKDSIQSIVSWANSVRPSQRADLAPDGTITLLFSDVEDSTGINARLGDDRWMQELRAHAKLVQNLVDDHDGHVVKSQGDGFMVAFKQPTRAVSCAVALQRAFAKVPRGKEPLRVRIGIHTGRAISEDGDFFGESVAFAARVAQHARGSEILVSAVVKELTEHDAGAPFSVPHEVELKGIPGVHRLFAIDWQRRVRQEQ